MCRPISLDIRQPGRQARAGNSLRQPAKSAAQIFRVADCEGEPYSSINYQLYVIQISRGPGVGIEITHAAPVQLSLELLQYASVINRLGVPSTDMHVD